MVERKKRRRAVPHQNLANEITFHFADGREALRFARWLSFGREIGFVPPTMGYHFDGQTVVLQQGPEVIPKSREGSSSP
jgi:hypothetical protein